MERYIINVVLPEFEPLRLLVPKSPNLAVSDLVDEIKKRISRLGTQHDTTSLRLHLGGTDGPIIDEADILSNVILDPKTETITATRPSKKPAAPPISASQQPDRQRSSFSSKDAIKLRVITPVLARAHPDLRSILTLRTSITSQSTLREVRALISDNIGISTSDTFRDAAECNCSFARQIEERALRRGVNFESTTIQNDDSSIKFILVYGRNQVRIMETATTNKSSLKEQIIEELGEAITSKEMTFVGGTMVSNTSDQYLKMPVVSVCSKERHGGTIFPANSNNSQSVLDMHTSEAPITITSLNIDLSVDDLGLADFAINGILDIYVVERKVWSRGNQAELGQDAIFLAGDAWSHSITQSKRGVSMLLSSLRIFASLIGARNMEFPSQDAVLHVIHLLTRFPPAVRAVHVLMNGKSPGLCERAALAQPIYEVLRDVVPMKLIRSDPGRILEGTRLLLGLVLEKAKHLKLKEDVQMPYISSLRVLDLRNAFTMEPIANVIQTPVGLVEEGYYEAFKEGGILYWKTGEQPLSALPLDGRTRRISLLSGGVIAQITILDIATLNFSRYENHGQAERLSLSRELSDLSHLSALCSRNKLSVIPPADLASAEAPVLTLDREGMLAVYTGRAACAAPGKDINIFRPASGGEESVDVSIITQLLVPILQQRQSEGTVIFDAYGDAVQRKHSEPDEIVMVCVDCSMSMSEDSEFYTQQEDNTDEDDSELGSSSVDSEEVEDDPTPIKPLDDIKEIILAHESFNDMLCIVHDAESHGRQAARKVLDILSELASARLAHGQERLDYLKTTTALAHYGREALKLEAESVDLKGLISGLIHHRQALYDFLIYRAAHSDILDEKWTWNEGEEIPKIIKKSTASRTSTFFRDVLRVPPEFLCPVSQELMEDPVVTCDGFTFERRNIERWFNIRKSSPLTGLDLDNPELRANGTIASQIKSWITAENLLQVASASQLPPSSESQTLVTTRSGGSADEFQVTFVSGLGSFNRRVRSSMTVNELYQVAFQGAKGRNHRFELYSKSVFAPPSERPLSSTNIQDKSDVHIIVPATTAGNSRGENGGVQYEDLCLVKVYRVHKSMMFSFWTPMNSTTTLTTVLFRYWRYLLKEERSAWVIARAVWTGMVDAGDSNFRGEPHDHWETLSHFMNPRYANGTLANEDLFGNLDKTSNSNEDVEMSNASMQNPLVLKLLVSNPWSKEKRSSKNLSRLDVLKTMFDAFINRLLAYNFKTHLGLITFQTAPSVAQTMTHAVENFRHRINRMSGEGDTALWDALALGNDQLSEYARQFPNARKRIICFSDGKDTKSKQRPCDVSMSLSDNKVVVDCFCIGDERNTELQTISYLSGGYIFQPESLEQAMAICEMEPVLSQLERPEIQIPRQSLSHSYDPFLRFAFALDSGNVEPELVTNDTFPRRREHNRIDDSFMPLASQVVGSSEGSSRAPVSVTAHSDSNLRPARIRAEIQNIVANPHPYYDVYMSNSDMSFWKIVMQGPPESAYSTGTFVLYLDMEEGYPALPPKARFITPIHHPNINRHGKVCHSILDRNWTSDTSNLQLLNTIYSLLLVPEFSDPINAVVTLNFHWDEVAFKDEVKEHIQKHATKTRAEWKAQLVTDS